MRRAAALPVLLALLATTTTTTTTSAAAVAAAKAPAASPPPPAPPNVTAEMSKGGCKAFADLIAASPDASSTYQSAVSGGMTVFCPADDAVRSFLPKYKNLSADEKAELLLFHAVPVHYSLGGLKSNNGPMNTLATDGAARSFNFTVQNRGDVVTISTAASGAGGGGGARVKSTAMDEDPLAIYVISAVVEPVELFKPVASPSPAPAPVPAAEAPGKAAEARKRHRAPAVADAPGPAADDDAAPVDQKNAKKSAAAADAPCDRWWLAAAVAAAVASALALA